jgi:hypothetical protein
LRLTPEQEQCVARDKRREKRARTQQASKQATTAVKVQPTGAHKRKHTGNAEKA